MNEDVKRFIEPIRIALLQECDHTQLEDSPLSPQEKGAWATYRRDLRDMPEDQNAQTVEEVVWPTKPGS